MEAVEERQRQSCFSRAEGLRVHEGEWVPPCSATERSVHKKCILSYNEMADPAAPGHHKWHKVNVLSPHQEEAATVLQIFQSKIYPSCPNVACPLFGNNFSDVIATAIGLFVFVQVFGRDRTFMVVTALDIIEILVLLLAYLLPNHTLFRMLQINLGLLGFRQRRTCKALAVSSIVPVSDEICWNVFWFVGSCVNRFLIGGFVNLARKSGVTIQRLLGRRKEVQDLSIDEHIVVGSNGH